MFRKIVLVFLVALFAGAPAIAQQAGIPVPGAPGSTGDPAPQRDRPFRQPAGPESEVSQAEQDPMAPPPPASGNWALSNVDGRVIAVFSLLWALAIVIAMGALLRAEATDEYHGAGPGGLTR